MRMVVNKLMQHEEAIKMVKKSPGAKELICKSNYVAPYRLTGATFDCPGGTRPNTFLQKLCAPGKNQPQPCNTSICGFTLCAEFTGKDPTLLKNGVSGQQTGWYFGK